MTLNAADINPGPFHTTTLVHRSEGVAHGGDATDHPGRAGHPTTQQRPNVSPAPAALGRGTVATTALSTTPNGLTSDRL
jgi:hypothetical protein